eukprot:jgi/Ulvmu1/1366/UM011_0094.1
MKLKDLHSLLQDVADFEKPKQKLEQYITGPHLASVIVHEIADRHEDLGCSTVIDLGCGTGMLGIACGLKDAPHVLGIDIDADALHQASQNIEEFEELPMDLLQADVCSSALPFHQLPVADIVISNPPFGSWRKGADCEFLTAAAKLAARAVYSLHKRATRKHVQRFCLESLQAASAEVVAELRYDLPATYKHHRQASKDIEVDLWKILLPGDR